MGEAMIPPLPTDFRDLPSIDKLSLLTDVAWDLATDHNNVFDWCHYFSEMAFECGDCSAEDILEIVFKLGERK